jgi:hypothetical protein
MKTIKKLGFVLVLAVTTILTSCSSDSNGGGGSAAEGTLKAKVAGSNYTSMQAATFATSQSGMLIIQGSDATGKAIQLMVAANAVGTYQISDDAGISAIGSYTEANISNPSASQTWAAPYENSGAAGSITISEITATNVKGTFTFTGKNQAGTDTKAITDGSFNVNFQN